jgi:glycine oxidase
LLIGSTEEDAGFEKRNTAAAVGGLVEFAVSLAPALASASVERVWSGLRPATRDGLPYLGDVPGIDNLFVAAGHFRCGLHLSTGTAVVMACLLRGEPPPIALAPFRLDRD